MAGMNVTVACLTLEQIFRLLHSAAMAVAVQRHTRLQYVEYTESHLINFLYGMSGKVRPGWTEVSQDWKAIDELTGEALCRFIDTFLKCLDRGPRDVLEYLERMEILRDDAIDGWQDVFRDASKINSEIQQETGEFIRTLARVKLASTVTIALCTGGAALAAPAAVAGTAGLVNLGYSVTATVAKNIASAKGAKALAIDVTKEAVKEGASRGAEAGAKHVAAAGFWRMAQVAPKWDEAVKLVEKRSLELARKVSKKRQVKAARKLATAEKALAQHTVEASKGMKLMKTGSNLAKAVPVVFAAFDVIMAVSEYQEDTAGL